MNCKKCGNEFEPKVGYKNFCSDKCKNGRTWTREDNIKKSLANQKSPLVKECLEKASLVNKETNNSSELTKKRAEEKLLSDDIEKMTHERARARVLLEDGNRCNKCGLVDWLGKEISLQLEHKDGNRFNNKRENLEILCPNCHSQTETHGGKNNKKDKIGERVLYETFIANNRNKALTFRILGMAGAGNYKRLDKIIEKVEVHGEVLKDCNIIGKMAKFDITYEELFNNKEKYGAKETAKMYDVSTKTIYKYLRELNPENLIFD
jgi:hypothetical protein